MRKFLKVIGWIIFFVGTCAVAWWLADRLFGGHGGIAAIIWGGLILLILVVIPQIKEWKSDSEELERQRRDSLKKAQEGEVPLEDDEVDDLDEDLDPDDLFADEDFDFLKDIDLSCDDDEEPEIHPFNSPFLLLSIGGPIFIFNDTSFFSALSFPQTFPENPSILFLCGRHTVFCWYGYNIRSHPIIFLPALPEFH